MDLKESGCVREKECFYHGFNFAIAGPRQIAVVTDEKKTVK